MEDSLEINAFYINLNPIQFICVGEVVRGGLFKIRGGEIYASKGDIVRLDQPIPKLKINCVQKRNKEPLFKEILCKKKDGKESVKMKVDFANIGYEDYCFVYPACHVVDDGFIYFLYSSMQPTTIKNVLEHFGYRTHERNY